MESVLKTSNYSMQFISKQLLKNFSKSCWRFVEIRWTILPCRHVHLCQKIEHLFYVLIFKVIEVETSEILKVSRRQRRKRKMIFLKAHTCKKITFSLCPIHFTLSLRIEYIRTASRKRQRPNYTPLEVFRNVLSILVTGNKELVNS